jgi:hypothetical protein
MKNNIASKSIALISTAALLLGLSAGAAFAQQNLLANASFEAGVHNITATGNLPGWGWVGPASDNSDYGVAQSSTPPNVAEQGDFYAYFHGHPTDGSQDCLGQSVALTPGSNYTFTCYLGTDGTTLGSGALMYILIGTSFGIDYSQDTLLVSFLPNSSNAIPYQKFTTNFTATTTSEILACHGVDGASSILMDNASIVLAVPTTPPLSLGLSPSNTLVFTWAGTTNGVQLQANASLDTTNWVTLTNTPETVGSNLQIVLPAPASNQFYRLMVP